MGCTPFGEHWDKRVDDMLIESSEAAIAVGRHPSRRRRRLLVRHDGSGVSGLTLSRAAAAREQARDPASRTCAPPAPRRCATRCYAVASRRLRRGDGHRRREAEGLAGSPGSRQLPDPQRRHRCRETHRARDVQPARARLRQEVRRRRGRDEGRSSPGSPGRTTTTAPATAAPSSARRSRRRRIARRPVDRRHAGRVRLLRGRRTAPPRRSSCGPRTRTGTPTSRST